MASIGEEAFSNTGSAVFYVSGIYAGPAIYGMRDGLSLSPSGEQTLTEATAVSATCTVPGATMHYTTDGTTPTTSSPVFAPYATRRSPNPSPFRRCNVSTPPRRFGREGAGRRARIAIRAHQGTAVPKEYGTMARRPARPGGWWPSGGGSHL